MYKIDANECSLSNLIEKTIVLVGFTSNQLILNFDTGDRIIIEGDLKTYGNDQQWSAVLPGHQATEVLRTLEAVVTTAEFDDDSNLILKLSNGFEMLILNDQYYESFRIEISGKSFIA